MPPKKYYGKFEYEERRLQDDFLDHLPRCKEGREATQLWNELDFEVCPGLKEKFGEVADSVLRISGLQIFC